MDSHHVRGRKASLRTMTTSGSQLTSTRYPSNLTYAQLDQRAKVNYLHWRTQALQAEQAAVALDALTEPFSVNVYLGLKPKPQPSAAVARACAYLLHCIQHLPPFDDLRKLYLSRDGRDLTSFGFRCVAKGHREAHERELRAVIAPAAAFEGQLRLARCAPAISACMSRHHRYQVHHYRGVFNGSEVDSVVYFSHDQQAQRLAERQRRARADLQRHALEARRAQPRLYRQHPTAHARTWQPKLRLLQQCSIKSNSHRSKLGTTAPLPSLPVKPGPTPLPDPAAEATDITDPQVNSEGSAVKADHATSDAASAASTVNLVAALMTLVRFVRGSLAPPGRRRYTKSPEHHTQYTHQATLSAATDWWPRTFSGLGRWSCAPRDCRKARSSMTMHHGCTDGTGTRPSFEPR